MQYRPETYLPWTIPGTGLIIAFVALTTLGFLTANLVGRKLVELGERILDRMPLVRSVYKGLKQVFETLFSESGSSFRKVGLIEFPSPGMWSLVFLSQPPSAQIADRLPTSDEHLSVFMPCTPNPTTGFFFYVPRARGDRARHSGRGRGQAHHVGRPDPAERRRLSEEALLARRRRADRQAARAMQEGAKAKAAAE